MAPLRRSHEPPSPMMSISSTPASAATGMTPVPVGGQPLLEAIDISKSYGAVRALRNASFVLAPGEIHGLCGHNGAGKSTMVKVVTGLIQPDEGRIVVAGEEVSFRHPLQAQAQGIALVDQELSLAPDLSVEENVFLGSLYSSILRHPRHSRARAADLLTKVGLEHIDPRTPLARLSIAERQLVEIARLLGRNARVLILDEPTATLSESEIERVFAVVREVVSEGKSAIYISHRLDEVLELCDRVSVFRDGENVATRATTDIAHRQELIKMMIGTELPAPTDESAEEIEGLRSMSITGLHVPGAVHDFDLSIRGGQIVGLTGQVGAGATEALRAIAGLIPEAHGTLVVDDRKVRLGSPTRALRNGIAYASNDRKGEGLFLALPVRTNLVATRLRDVAVLGIVRPGAIAGLARKLASFVRVDAKRIGSRVETLSGGNQQKVFLGRCLERGDVKLLLLDEPTRGVDVAGRAEIHYLIKQAALSGVAVLYASTEIDEILELSQVVVTMFGGRIIAARPRAEATAENISADMTLSGRTVTSPAVQA